MTARAAGPAPGRWLTIADLAATWFFAVEGAIVARHHFDVLGILAMGLLTAVGGGLVRDALIGCAPPACLLEARWLIAAVAGGETVVLGGPLVERTPAAALLTCDAAALALFAVTGAMKAVEFQIAGPAAALMGAVTAVGGGIIRDTVLSVAPAAFGGDTALVAALIGAAVAVLARRRRADRALAVGLGFAACILLRLIAVWQGWTLPLP